MTTIKAHLLYLKYVLRHKWYVFLACLQYGLIWRGIKHDWTKFLPSEWFPYVQYFHGEKVPHPTKQVRKGDEYAPLMEPPQQVQEAFDRAWNHHQKRNSHHWQYWLLHPDNPRPNLTHQSHDGGMSHGYIRTVTGKDAAIVWDADIDWWKPDAAAVRQLEDDLWHAPIALKMPDADMKEMLCDWRGAGKAQGRPNTWEWYEANKRNMRLHPETRAWIEAELAEQKRRHEAYEKMRGMGVIQ